MTIRPAVADVDAPVVKATLPAFDDTVDVLDPRMEMEPVP